MDSASQDHHKEQPVIRGGAPLDEARGVVILIHGRGASAESMLTITRNFDLPDVAYLAPQAYRHTWYPHSFLAPLQQNEPALTSALSKVASLIATAEEAGHPRNEIALLGFSQGACLASEFVARHPQRYGGLIAFSGGLIGTKDNPAGSGSDKLFEYEGSFDGMPAFLGCSDVDPHIPVERVEKTSEVFQSLGADVKTSIYEGMGHTIIQDEIDQAQELLQNLVS